MSVLQDMLSDNAMALASKDADLDTRFESIGFAKGWRAARTIVESVESPEVAHARGRLEALSEVRAALCEHYEEIAEDFDFDQYAASRVIRIVDLLRAAVTS